MSESTQLFLLGVIFVIKCFSKDFLKIEGILECKNKIQHILIISVGMLNSNHMIKAC